MLRKLAIAIAASGAMMSAINVHALGMGDIELESALNQPLDARIKLLKASELEDWEMKPNLASPDEFDKSGVEYVFFLNSLKFEIERENGETYVHVTSQKAVVEPFLNFLVQVDWPNGRLLREYTLLLDPPVFTEEPVEAVAPASTDQYYDDQGDTYQQEPETLPGMAPSSSVEQEEFAEEKYMAEEPKAQPEPKAEVYKVRPNDTLWEVAIKTRPDRRISPQQAMLAIQDLNPDAFVAGNINRLKKNQVLRVPSEEQMLSRSFDEAVSEVALQNQAMAKRKAQLDATRKDAAIARDDKLDGARLKLLAGGEATAEAERGASGQVAAKTAGDQSRLEKELSITLENLDKSTRENQELRSRLDSLEDQINTLQRLINLKDEQMVALQSGMAGKAKQGEVSPESMEKAEMPKPKTEEKGEDLNFASEEKKPEAKEKPIANTEQKKPVQPKPLPAPVTPVEKPFDPVAFVMDNPPVLGAGLGALLLALLGIQYARKRKEKQQEEVNEDSAPLMTDTLDDVDLSDELATDVDDLESDLGSDDLDLGEGDSPMDSGELGADTTEPDLSPEDVMGEVDVYLAYNRLEPARDLLERSLAANPERQEYRQKLIEILTELGDEDSAEEQRQLLGGDVAETPIDQPIEDVNEDFAMDFDLDSETSSELDNEFNADFGNDELLEESSDLDFDLDGLELNSDDAEIPSLESSDLDSELSLDDDLDLGMDFESSESTDDLEDLDLDLGSDESAELDSLDVSLDDVAGEQSDDSVDFDLSDFESEVNTESEGLELDSLDADDNSMDFSLDEGSEADSIEDISFDESVSGAESSDDLEFNLDDSGEELDLELSGDELDSIPGLDAGDEISLDESSEDNDISFDLGEDDASLDEIDLDTDDESLDAVSDGSDDIELDIESLGEEESDALPDFEEGLTLDEEIELPELTEEVGEDSDVGLDSLAGDDIELPTLEAESDSLDDLPELDDEFDISVPQEQPEELESTETVAAEYKEELPSLADSLDADNDGEDFPPLGDLDDLDLENLGNDLDFLSGTDESETKLDLARAYIDMEDQDGAREILQEVLEEGSDQQKEEANKLLDSLV